MRAKLIVEGKEFPIEINDPELQKLIVPKKTGYERVDSDKFWFETDSGDHFWMRAGTCNGNCEGCAASGNQSWCNDLETNADMYNAANYYSDETVAKNNARADKLMRQLRRFAVEHRTLDERDRKNYYIMYDDQFETLYRGEDVKCRQFGAIYFDTKYAVDDAILTFHDELIWYFTEYKDSL